MNAIGLPNEILCLILEELDVNSLVCCTKVCRQLYLLAKESHIYDYKVGLALSNLEQNPEYSAGALARLMRLEQHQKAWRTFTWSTTEKYNLDSVHSWELAGGVLAFGYPDNFIRFIRLPSRYRGIERKEWSFRLDKLRPVEDFSIDPSKNLLVVLTKRMIGSQSSIDAHFLDLDNGAPHPRAHIPTLCTQDSNENVDWEYDIRPFGSHVGIKCSATDTDESQLSVWNWETGSCVRRISDVDCFAFLTEHLILYPQINKEGWYSHLVVVDLVDPHPAVEFELPSFYNRAEVYIHSESLPTSVYPPNHSQVPFTVSRHDALFGVGCRVWDENNSDVVIFVPLSILLPHVEKARTNTITSVVTWNSWGPGTRLLPFVFSDIWVCYIHGLRAAVLNQDTLSPRGASFDIYDLNPLLERQREDLQRSSDLKHVEKPRCAISGQLLDLSPSSLMMSEDALLVVSGDEADIITVYSF
ncbi:hypothetical protein L218DRAFT_958999 [Marasmius fiardii PR-910]|nr:hypothetical protein L218DRAFT_958999 [Marasmius fiardii PR-910]